MKYITLIACAVLLLMAFALGIYVGQITAQPNIVVSTDNGGSIRPTSSISS